MCSRDTLTSPSTAGPPRPQPGGWRPSFGVHSRECLLNEAVLLVHLGLGLCPFLRGWVAVLAVVSIERGQPLEPDEFPGQLLGQGSFDHAGDGAVLQRRRPAHLFGEGLADRDVQHGLALALAAAPAPGLLPARPRPACPSRGHAARPPAPAAAYRWAQAVSQEPSVLLCYNYNMLNAWRLAVVEQQRQSTPWCQPPAGWRPDQDRSRSCPYSATSPRPSAAPVWRSSTSPRRFPHPHRSSSCRRRSATRSASACARSAGMTTAAPPGTGTTSPPASTPAPTSTRRCTG